MRSIMRGPAALATAAALTVTGCAGGSVALNVSNRFVAPATWHLEGEVVTAPSLVCLGGQPCPSIHRRWTAPKDGVTTELDRVIADAGYDLAQDGECEPVPMPQAAGSLCRFEGYHGDLEIQVTVRSVYDSQDTVSVVLSVR